MKFPLLFLLAGLGVYSPLYAQENFQCLIFYRTQGVPSIAIPGPKASKAVQSGIALIEFKDQYYSYSMLLSDPQNSLLQMKATDLKTSKKIDWCGHISSEMLREHSAQLLVPVEGETTIEVEGKKYTVKLESAVLSCQRQ